MLQRRNIMKKTIRSGTLFQRKGLIKLVTITLASSALTLALTGAASATYFYDNIVNDPDLGTGNNAQNILSAQHYKVVGSSPIDQFFTITLKDAAASNTNYDFMIDNKPGIG
jgi:hypothetical protein